MARAAGLTWHREGRAAFPSVHLASQRAPGMRGAERWVPLGPAWPPLLRPSCTVTLERRLSPVPKLVRRGGPGGAAPHLSQGQIRFIYFG